MSLKLFAPSLACALLLSPATALSQSPRKSDALASLVETEQAFARASVERGVRESFLAFFAEDGISFQPAPVRTRDTLLARPAPPARPPVTLDWFPAYGDVSAAGDLGYTTGPYVFSDDTKKKPPSYGYYFTVWRRQPGGNWRVMLDLGIDTPPLSPSTRHLSFRPARTSRWKRQGAKPDGDAVREELFAAENAFSGESLLEGAARAFARFGSDEARFYRGGTMPVVGGRAIRSYLKANVAKLTWEVMDIGAAQSGDFAYAYGSYKLTPVAGGGGGGTETGYYARVWRRDARGRWRAVVSVAHPAPPRGE